MSFGRVAISRRVVVNLHDGTALSGILWDDRKPILILRSASLHQAGQHVPLDGEILIEYTQVAFIQLPETDGGR